MYYSFSSSFFSKNDSSTSYQELRSLLWEKGEERGGGGGGGGGGEETERERERGGGGGDRGVHPGNLGAEAFGNYIFLGDSIVI